MWEYSSVRKKSVIEARIDLPVFRSFDEKCKIKFDLWLTEGNPSDTYAFCSICINQNANDIVEKQFMLMDFRASVCVLLEN